MIIDNVNFKDNQSGALNQTANDFALSLLMPEEDVRRCIDNRETDIAVMARKFNVSVDDMRTRVKMLGYKLITR